MTTIDKIGVLAESAKYDASCSTAGSARANTPGGIGTGAVGGICHSWSADGRCVALLKVLLSNVCVYDCAYCVNRRSSDIRRATFEPEELIRLIMDFYKRNYIEGAFLSSGVLGCPDATMERLISVARTLRTRERFNGYLHVKVIPGASESLILEAARWADRVSVNIELPSAASLALIAPDKTPASIFGPMRTLARAGGFEPRRLLPGAGAPATPSIEGGRVGGADTSSLPPRGGAAETPGAGARPWPALPEAATQVAEPRPLYDARDSDISVMEARGTRRRNPGAPLIPAGQTTQLVVGASPESDATILSLAENLYLAYDVRRVYYSAFIPVSADERLPAIPGPPLAREHRLYQADWLFRFYGFTAAEILDPARPFLDSLLDPKSDWALRNMGFFPVDINSASYAELLRVPGMGPVSASRVLRARRSARLRQEALAPLGVVMKRARWFITCSGRCVDAVSSQDRFRRPGTMAALRALLADDAASRLRPGQFEFDWGSPQ